MIPRRLTTTAKELALVLSLILFGDPDIDVFAWNVEFIDAPETGVELGLGWDSATSMIIPGRCVKFSPIQEGGQTLHLDLREVSDSSELAESLNISASVSVSSLFGSASARSSFAKNKNVKASSTTFSLRATAQNGVMFAGPAKPPHRRRYAFTSITEALIPIWMKGELDDDHENLAVVLEDWAKEILEEKGIVDFRRHCGDHFVSTITSGAEVLAVITFEAKSVQERKKLSAAIRASYSIVSAEASTDLDKSELSESSNLQASYLQIGGARGAIPSTNAELQQKLSVLADEAAEAPNFYEIGIVAYEDLPDWLDVPKKGIDPDTLHSLLIRRDLELFSLYNTIDDILLNEDDSAYSARSDTLLFPPRLKVLETLQDRALRIRQLIAAFQEQRHDYELDEMTPGDPNNLEELHRVANSLLELRLPGRDNPRFNLETSDYETIAGNVEDYLRGLDIRKMRMWLPLPQQVAIGDTSDYASDVVEYYVGRQARRVCGHTPAAEGCLDNDALRGLREEVTPNFHQLVLSDGAEGYLFANDRKGSGCLHVEKEVGKDRIIAIPTNVINPADVECTLFRFELVDQDQVKSEFWIRSGSDYLGFSGYPRLVLHSLPESDDKQAAARWRVSNGNMLMASIRVNVSNPLSALLPSGPICLSFQRACLSKQGHNSWFFIPKHAVDFLVGPGDSARTRSAAAMESSIDDEP